MLIRWFRSLRVNSSRIYLDRFVQLAANAVAPGGRVLDAGAGEAPYRGWFGHCQYHPADFCKVDKPYATSLAFVCDLKSLPVAGGVYDLVLLTQVLEHLPEPRLVLAEIHRALRAGGQLWLTAPLFYEEHEQPYDYYRYTQFGFRHLLSEAGFVVEKIEWLEGYFGTLAYQCELAARSLPVKAADYGGGLTGGLLGLFGRVLRLGFAFFSLVFTRLDLRTRHTSSGMCKNYALVARKPG